MMFQTCQPIEFRKYLFNNILDCTTKLVVKLQGRFRNVGHIEEDSH